MHENNAKRFGGLGGGAPSKEIAANMMFNLGFPRYSKFKKKIQAVKDEDWFEASVQMEQSKWFHQVPNRAKRLIERMKSI